MGGSGGEAQAEHEVARSRGWGQATGLDPFRVRRCAIAVQDKSYNIGYYHGAIDRDNALRWLYDICSQMSGESDTDYKNRIEAYYENDATLWQQRFALFTCLSDAIRIMQADWIGDDRMAVAIGQAKAALDNAMRAKDHLGTTWKPLSGAKEDTVKAG